ncbi:FKBP-type peptidyl-prolyl cis-trans isomerase [Teredinibacter haidensis]|uniref:FKBP-type peptidyl-prolyl cis-trans isomerase n=1 Tax=Teredinibacter haidensis TaxID=2731755 RepID=UPI000948BD88|nr:FKBP-type peptidyl-prolyl cis-trans isomerase [Teredinibacter haidensis]
MKKITLVAIAAAAVFVAGCNKEDVAVEPKIETLDEKMSYFMGHSMASQAKTVEFNLHPELVALAIKDVQGGAEERFTEEQMRATVTTFQTEQKAKREAFMAKRKEEAVKLAETNTVAGTAFLTENGQKEGVVTTESGLQYKVEREGAGPKPKAQDKVLVNYRGTTLEGEEFDSSYSRGEPSEFRVGGLIKGWIEALQLMPVGSKWTLYIPGSLAYGEQGIPNRQNGGFDIEPNKLLVFEMELLEINPTKKAVEAPAEEKPAAE